MPEPWPDLPARLRRPLLRGASGELPAPVAVMQLCAEARDQAEVDRAANALGASLESGSLEVGSASRASEMLRLLSQNPDAWRITKAVLAHAEHDRPPSTVEADLAHWAGVFDRAARASPEGSVALYSLGNPGLLRAATEEAVSRLREWRVLGASRTVLDIGCGIGRFAEALSPEVAHVVGTDISREMLRAARTRCAGLSNVGFVQTSGRDLACFAGASFELVLAADLFPYLARSGGNLFDGHVAEIARVLKPGGDCLILNLAYDDPEAHTVRLRQSAAAQRLVVRRCGTRAFRLWDGLTFHLSRAA
jgi:ubiquinone/menaquinone biosynthesis C-methylase UbiE